MKGSMDLKNKEMQKRQEKFKQNVKTPQKH